MNKYLPIVVLIFFSCTQSSRKDAEIVTESKEMVENLTKNQIPSKDLHSKPFEGFVFQDSIFKLTNDYLGSLYLMKENDSIFTQLLLINKAKSQADTLYYIDEQGRHFNGEGEYGALSRSKITKYFLLNVKQNNMTIYGADADNRPVTDPLWLGWNEDKEIFEWIRTP